MEYITNDTTQLNYLTNEHTEIENIQLKQIIRENDSRIFYLERKLNLATEYINYLETQYSREDSQQHLHTNICYSCKHTYLYDEIMCDCNMFCDHALCKSCYYIWKNKMSQNDIQLCQDTQCRIWTCEKNDNINFCKECEKQLCVKHYQDTNINRKNWICIYCCEKTKTEYGYESV